jgi:transcriptional regulator with XRE-family HTH domain
MTRFQFEVESRGITGKKIAEVMEVSEATAGTYIKGTVAKIPVDKAILASEFLGVPVDVLFSEYNPEIKEAA